MALKRVTLLDSSKLLNGDGSLVRQRKIPTPPPAKGTEPSPLLAHEQPDAIEKALTTVYEKMPHWVQDNASIRSGYRYIENSYHECAKSLFFLHNETMNVWTHLLGSLSFIGLAFGTIYAAGPWSNAMEKASWLDVVMWSCFFIGAIGCMGLSAAFHLFACHSQDVASAWNKADYVGIVTLIVGSAIPAIYYGFLCSPTLQTVYIAMMAVAGTATICVSASDRFRTARFRVPRTIIFVALGASGVVPIIHAMILWGFDFVTEAVSLGCMAIMGLFYVLGAVLYTSRFPERYWPGKFDIWFHSHSIFHIMVIAGAVTHYIGLLYMHHFWATHSHTCALARAGVAKLRTGVHQSTEMAQRVTYRRRLSYNTKSNKVRKVKTPGGRLVVQYVHKKAKGPKCGDCGTKLPGLPALRPIQYSRLSKSKKNVTRAYGGSRCGHCVRERIVRAFLIEEQKIVKKVLKSQ
ncbi:hypothetical protein SeMB42_g02037 [Synchytrium endobioticum]|uniref:Large ribosomal subunit protein eL34 n=1 Tax=Synchytrium endobioticum TaxID=286115 RepID=A0A507DJH7_9FUNG|nr:hypothetical protein SeMB42_g02037 [Synchytrium endobioticum]